MDSANYWEDKFAQYYFDIDLNDKGGKVVEQEKESISNEQQEVILEEVLVSSRLEDARDEEKDEKEEKPKRVVKPITKDDMEMLLSQQNTCKEIIHRLHEKTQQIIPLCRKSQQPKGIRIIVKKLKAVMDVSIATKALISNYLETKDTIAFHTIEDSGLKRRATNTYRMVLAHDQSMTEGLEVVENMIKNDEDRMTINLRSCIIKEQALTLYDNAKKQATAFCKAIESYPSDNAPLDVLARFAEKKDEEAMKSIDDTLTIAQTAMVLTEDAPRMIEALNRDDTKTIITLQKNLIDNIFKAD